MPSIREIDSFMCEFAPKELSEPWDNDGVMLCDSLDKKINSITVCLEINQKTVKKAIENRSELIITHHPFIFKLLKSLCGEEFKLVSQLISGGISVLSYHTRLDAAEGGVNDVLAKRLGLNNLQPFAVLGRVGELEAEMTAFDFAKYIKERLCCGEMRCFLNDQRPIKRVAIVGGAGKDFVSEAADKAQAFITGDLSHNAFITARELGISIYDAGHYYTEKPIAGELAERILQKYPTVSVFVADSECPYIVV